MSLTFAGSLDRAALTVAAHQLTDLVGSAAVADAWKHESALPGLTVGGLTRHLVSQPECAVEFLTTPGPPDAPVMTLVGRDERVDWLHAPVGAPRTRPSAMTSISWGRLGTPTLFRSSPRQLSS